MCAHGDRHQRWAISQGGVEVKRGGPDFFGAGVGNDWDLRWGNGGRALPIRFRRTMGMRL